MNGTMFVAAAGAVLIGLSLGLLGSGGSILTVPALVYLVGQPEKVAIAGSLVIVGAIAVTGVANYMRTGHVSWRHVMWFALPGMAGTWFGAGLSVFVAGSVQLLVFATVMILAATFMLRPPTLSHTSPANWKLVAEGVLVGGLTGFVGVGGGFLIVPSLVFFGGLAMRHAIGTSLAIIVLNTAAGFLKHSAVLSEHGLALDWHVIGLFVAAGVAGSFAGVKLSGRLPQAVLRKLFAVFVLIVAMYIGWQTLPDLASD